MKMKSSKVVDRFHMCAEFYKFGIASAAIGVLFFLVGIFSGLNLMRISIIVFFLILSVFDLALYVKHGEG